MKHKKRTISIILIILLLGIPSIAFASDITSARYQATIQVSENGTAATSNTAAVFTANLTSLMNDTATNAAMQYGGSDKAFMPPPPGSSNWTTWIDSIGQSQNIGYNLYLKDASGGKIRYFPGTEGMTTADSATLELGDNFTIEQKGWVNTANGTDKNLAYKSGAWRTYVSPTVSGNITSAMFVWATGSTWDSPYTAVGATWTADGNVKDGLTGTYASHAYAANIWGDYMEMSVNSTESISVRYWATFITGTIDQINIWLYWDGAWHDEYTGAIVTGAWQTVVFDTIPRTITDSRVRFHASANPVTARFHEFEVNEAEESDTKSVSATGLSSGEYTVTTSMENPFLSLGIDATNPITPVSDNLVMNSPLWQTECSSSPFPTIDSTAHVSTVSEAIWTLDAGYEFDGVDDYISVAHNANQLLTTGGTIEAWIKPDTIGETDGRIVDKSINTGGGDGYSFRIAANNRLYFVIDSSGLFSATNSVIVGDGNWYHVVATWTNTGYSILYVNGAQSGGTTTLNDPAGITTANAMRIGNRSTATDRTFDGDIGEVRIYNTTLTPTEVLQNYNATKSKYTSGDIYTYSTLTGVPNTSDNWTFCQSAAVPYLEYQEITIDGVQAQYIEWEYSDNFTDQSVNDNYAIPTFRTDSSNLNVTAALTSITPITEAKVTTFTLGAITDILTTVPGAIPQLFTELNFDYIPAAEAVNAILDEGDIPQALWWFPVIFIGISIVGLLAYGATTRRVNQGQITDAGDQGSLLLMCIVIGVLLAVFGIMNPIPFWPAILFWIPAAAIMLSQKHHSVG